MSGRTLSQFYWYLKKLIIPSTADDFVLSLWISRLPIHVQYILATTEEAKVKSLILMTDGVHEIRPATVRIYAFEAEKKATPIWAGLRSPRQI